MRSSGKNGRAGERSEVPHGLEGDQHSGDAEDAPGGTRGDQPSGHGADVTEFASTRQAATLERRTSDDVEFASARSDDAARRAVNGRPESREAPERELEIPSDKVTDYTRDAGARAATLSESRWRSCDVRSREEAARRVYADIGAARGLDTSAEDTGALRFQELGPGEYEGWRVDGAGYTVIDSQRLRSDDPSGVVGAVAKARQYQYQEARMKGGFRAVENDAERIEDQRFDAATPDYRVDTREPFEVSGAAARHDYDMNARVADARIAECSVCRQYWRQQWTEGTASPTAPTESPSERAVVRGNDADVDLDRADVAASRRAGERLARETPPEDWALASTDDGRREFVRRASDVVQEEYGLDSLPEDRLRFEQPPTDSGATGEYDPQTDTVYINPRLLDERDPDSALENVLHESRHRYQHADMRAQGAGSRFFDAYGVYPHDRDSSEGFVDYAYNDTELDARSAGGVGMWHYWETSARRRAARRAGAA